jgi:glycerophosphoryl diester phosphodiesterase
MGYHVDAPEDSLAGYKLSKEQGYDLVETDVRFTSDGIPVLLHDATINRTGRNQDGTEISTTINIADITYQQALQYDFGIYKGAEYSCQLPTFEEFIVLCKRLNLYPYIELKQGSGVDESLIQTMQNIIVENGMEDHVTWISFGLSILRIVRNVAPCARLGVLKDSSTNTIYACSLLKTGRNDVFMAINYTFLDSSLTAECKTYGLPIELYTVNSDEVLLNSDGYISGIITDTLNSDNVFTQ